MKKTAVAEAVMAVLLKVQGEAMSDADALKFYSEGVRWKGGRS